MRSFSYGDHTLTWEEHSPGGHSLIFINGYSANRTIWRRELALLAPFGRCVTLDLPGHFPATAPRGYSRLTQAELLDLETAAIAAIAGDGGCTLVGHSTGGLVALAAAARLPGQVRRVVALAPVLRGPLTGALGLFARLLRLPGGYGAYKLLYLLTKLSPAAMRLAVSSGYVGDQGAYWRSPVVPPTLRHWLPSYKRSTIRSFAALLLMLDGCDLREEARRVACPTLIIHGAADPVVPVAGSRWLAANLPAVTLVELPGLGHLPHWERPDLADQALLGWLAGHPAA